MTQPPPNSIHPLTRHAWRDWLEAHHSQDDGIWLISYKQATGQPRMTYDEAVEEALCFGWIDSKASKLDEARSMRWFTPRKAGSNWSKLNKARVERLIAAGLMTPTGQAKIEAAQKDGTWTALDAVEALEIPPDLKAALASYPDASRHFAAFPRSAKRSILVWIFDAKRTTTRAKRIAETARLAQNNVRANQ